MHTRTIAAILTLATGAALALTGCSGSSGHGHTAVTYSGHYTPLATTTTATAEPPIPSGDKLATGARTAACWRAIRVQYAPGTVQLTGAPTTPPACASLSSEEISAVALDVTEHQLG